MRGAVVLRIDREREGGAARGRLGPSRVSVRVQERNGVREGVGDSGHRLIVTCASAFTVSPRCGQRKAWNAKTCPPSSLDFSRTASLGCNGSPSAAKARPVTVSGGRGQLPQGVATHSYDAKNTVSWCHSRSSLFGRSTGRRGSRMVSPSRE